METRAHHVLIGLFTILVAAAALLFCLWLNKSSGDKNVSYYTIVFNEAVSGLSKGSPVQYSGIKVGDVSSLTLDPQDPRKVLARIRIVGNVPIKQDTGAKLALAGITGTSLIQLTNGSPQSPKLEGKGDSDPVIIATPSPLSALLANGEDVMTNVNDVLLNAKQFLAPDNARRFGETLQHLEKATSSLAAQSNGLGELVRQIGDASQQANAAMLQANRLLSHQGTDAMNNMQQAMASLATSSKQIEQLLSQNQGALNSGAQGLAEIGPAVAELRSTLASVRAISRKLENNPGGYLLGKEKIQEFQP
ncbi:MlaD family protein [Herbaspirillum chlorophenolicum]|jgi:phospholipid/cholesterol/gamma-HCH transport system substrate-binding protein|uniref:MlaD family protein n=1 Tax=Herbaspirillum chlorophenolicum TaxID=211589 RepID=UPI00067AC4D3|nr:MlaD family protein [Herbaspirillum chlorophenolicum]